MTIEKKLRQLSMEDLRSIVRSFEIHSYLTLLTLSRYEREVYIEMYCRGIPWKDLRAWLDKHEGK